MKTTVLSPGAHADIVGRAVGHPQETGRLPMAWLEL